MVSRAHHVSDGGAKRVSEDPSRGEASTGGDKKGTYWGGNFIFWDPDRGRGAGVKLKEELLKHSFGKVGGGEPGQTSVAKKLEGGGSAKKNR